MDQPNASQHLPLLDRHLDTPANELAVFDNAAIMKHIFKDLEPHSLFCIALVCRRFKDPALDVLWSSLDSLLPLLGLLQPLTLINNTYVYQGSFEEVAWAIFDAYARRVKRLALTVDNDGNRVAYGTIHRLSRHRPCFFPDLKDLICPSVLPIHIPLFSLLSPTLQRLELGGDQTAYGEVIEPAVSIIIYDSEVSRLNLKRLILHGNPPSNLLDSLYQLSNLLQLSVSAPVNFDFFKAVGKLDNLENLTVVLSEPPDVPVLEPGFGNLRTLNITSPLLPLRPIFEGFATIRMTSISITGRDSRQCSRKIPMNAKKKGVKKASTVPPLALSAYSIITECFEILHSRWRLSLQSIILDQDGSYYAADTLLMNLFPPLSCFEKLEHLQFCRSTFRPTDTGVQSLALACPIIQKLYFPIYCPDPSMDPQIVLISPNATFAEGTGLGGVDEVTLSQSQKKATIASLWSLAELCPKLTHLQIGLDITTIPPFFSSNVHSHGLSSLSVGSYNGTNVGLTSTFEIARHIHHLFPYLTIQSHDRHNSTTWEQIGYAVGVYKQAVVDEDARRSKKHSLDSQTAYFLSH